MAPTFAAWGAAGKIGAALLIANEIRGLIVIALIVKAWIATGAQF